jgi:hypothetical protein
MKSKTAKVKGVPISLSCLYTNVPLFHFLVGPCLWFLPKNKESVTHVYLQHTEGNKGD